VPASAVDVWHARGPAGQRFVIEDPRTVFSAETDRQVLVYFEWEGRPGTHHCEARWKDPSRQVVLVSPIDYYRLPLGGSASTGP